MFHGICSKYRNHEYGMLIHMGFSIRIIIRLEIIWNVIRIICTHTVHTAKFAELECASLL